LFPKVPDQHKTGKPLVPNGLGVTYVLFTTVYLFLIYFSGVAPASNGVSAPLTLAVCILFGGFMGLLDDWMDLKWRYKAFMPLIASLPLIYLAIENGLRTSMSLPFIGTIEFGEAYYFLIIPLIVMIVTNTVNQLGGLNGLESLCPAIILMGLMALSPSYILLMFGPIVFWLILAGFNLQGIRYRHEHSGVRSSHRLEITLAYFNSSLRFQLFPDTVNRLLRQEEGKRFV
jgi:UDP-N-acetylmuramyl pentapeptide phosphotransferase/UDP-N-acetylglucosamine-1-phosphate transferase